MKCQKDGHTHNALSCPQEITTGKRIVTAITTKEGVKMYRVTNSCGLGIGDFATWADATLDVAAPELLEAAKNTVEYYSKTQPGRECLNDPLNPCGGLTHWGGGPACPLCSARAAIAKAEGH